MPIINRSAIADQFEFDIRITTDFMLYPKQLLLMVFSVSTRTVIHARHNPVSNQYLRGHVSSSIAFDCVMERSCVPHHSPSGL